MTTNQRISMSFLSDVLKDHSPVPMGVSNYYSVLIPVIEKDDGLSLLYQVRAETLRRQPGEISFPGGRMETGELPVDCAVRETREELGIADESIHVISRLNYINSYSNFTMYSFLGRIDESAVDNAELNRDEVKEVFTVPLDYLMKNEPFIYRYRLKADINEDFPYEKYGISEDYKWQEGVSWAPFYVYGDKVIWGLTGRLTMDLIRLIKEKL